MSSVAVKICGVRDIETALTAARAGADFLGFVFFRKSPRFLTAEAAEDIIVELKQVSFDEAFSLPKLVGLFVDAGEKELSEVAPYLTHFQFHGHEDAERCAEMGSEFAVDIIKAVPVAGPADIEKANAFADATDIILFDAKPPPGAARPGGHGIAYDWASLAGYKGETPYMVAGGLTPDNVKEAVASQAGASGFLGVDVSSGVESAPGRKDDKLIEAFVQKAKA